MMSDPYEKVKGGRLSFKGGDLASRSKSIDKQRLSKKKKQKKKKKNKLSSSSSEEAAATAATEEGATAIDDDAEKAGVGEIVYTIDAAKRMKYDQLFPVEAKKFRYDPNNSISSSSVEQALDDRVKKKADRYCK